MAKVTLNIQHHAGTLPSAPAQTTKRAKLGQPRKFKTPADLSKLIEEYFDYCEQAKDIPNKAGMALFLNTAKQTLHDYERGQYDSSTENYSDSIRRAYLLMESEWVQQLKKPAPTGSIFYLKNAFAYRDQIDLPPGGYQVNFFLPPEIAEKYQLPAKPAPIDGNKDIIVPSLPDGEGTQ